MSTIFLEAFGQLSGLATIDTREEDLHSVFRERAELMRWATTTNNRPLLWSMEEAEITAYTDPCRIGWAQVGLHVGGFERTRASSVPVQGSAFAPLGVQRQAIDPAIVLPALIQCFDDALRRFGDVELSGFQVTTSFSETNAQSCLSYLVAVLNWFNTDLKAGADAIVSFDQDLVGSHAVSELVATLRHRNTGPFEFRTSAAVTEKYKVKVPVETPYHPVPPQADIGVSVTMPEWTPSAAGWVLAGVVDAARLIEPGVSDFAIRVTRVR